MTNLEFLIEEREEYCEIEWESSNGTFTKITNMSDNYLLNVLKKVAQKAVLAHQLEYVTEFQTYNEIHYSNWTRYFYSEYLYRKHEEIVIEETIETPTNFTQEAQDFLDVSYPQPSNGVYQIS